MNKKTNEAVIARELYKSVRGWYILSQALSIAIKKLEKVKEPHKEINNIADMKLLQKYIFNCPNSASIIFENEK
ncbi:MAG: hypothetical protein ACFFDN_06895 [Candidatus Hodarchaeota archaeon]